MTCEEKEYMPRTHAEMMVEAAAISPKARVRKSEYFEGQWEIYIPTAYSPVTELPEAYRGTPAWEASQRVDYGHGDELYRWGNKNGHMDSSIEEVADRYNLVSAREQAKQTAIREHLSANGLDYDTITSSKPTPEVFAIWSAAARLGMDAMFKNPTVVQMEAEFMNKWGCR